MSRGNIFTAAVFFVLFMAAECPAYFREVTFGRYYQASGTEELSPLEWLVLGENDNAMLIITAKCIDNVPYNSRRSNVSWEFCTLRSWLNGEFLRTAFTESEQNAIIRGGLPDKVFLLGRDEVSEYMPNEDSRQCVPTDYAYGRGVYTNDEGLCAWWTRTPGRNSQAVYLSSYGTFGNRHHYVDDRVIGVRPALWVKKEFFADTGTTRRESEEILFSANHHHRKLMKSKIMLCP